MPWSALAFLVMSLVWFGFGCKEPTYDQPTIKNWRGAIQDKPKHKPAAPPPQPASVSKQVYDNERIVAPEVIALRQALGNLASATSLRASLKLPPAEGQTQPTQGELVFVRDKGLRGRINISAAVSSELYMAYGQVYFRSNTSTWQTITGTPDAERLQQFFRIAFPSQLRQNQVLISDSARILEVSEDPTGCRRYHFDEVTPQGEREKTVVCVKDRLPVYIINQFAEGETEVRYRDINQTVELAWEK